MFGAVLFDMDGVLIDSEPFWQEAEIRVFGKYGLRLTSEDCATTMGLRVDEVVAHWFRLRPWAGADCKAVEAQIVDEVISLVRSRGLAKPGVDRIFNTLSKFNLKIGLASSSYVSIIEAVLEKLGLRNKFSVIHSAQFERQGKPAPDVYLSAARMVEVEPEQCLVFEDSLNGVLAAKAARMTVVAIPDQASPTERIREVADYTIPSFFEFDVSWLKG